MVQDEPPQPYDQKQSSPQSTPSAPYQSTTAPGQDWPRTYSEPEYSLLLVIQYYPNTLLTLMDTTRELPVLESKWLHLQEFYDITCDGVHPHTNCSQEIIDRFVVVAKSNTRLYLALHLVPFLLFRMKTLKTKSKGEILRAIGRLVKRYVGSMLFMSSLVSIYKAVICFREWADLNIQKGLKRRMPFWFMLATVLASTSMFFEQEGRRKQISIYAFVRALPAFYTILHRRNLLTIPYLKQLLFVSTFGLLSLCYHKHKEHLSLSIIFQKVWGRQE